MTRSCQRCGDPIPGDKRSDAKFCSENCRKRDCSHRHRGTCGTCGGPLKLDSAWTGGDRCKSCQHEQQRAEYRAKAERVAAMWTAGATWGQIGAEFGWTAQQVSAEFGRIRRIWPDLLPHRRTPEQRERIRGARWGAAA